jgi:hypothetical protein
MVDTFHRLGHVADFPMRSPSKETRHYLSVRRDRRRGLHFAGVR